MDRDRVLETSETGRLARHEGGRLMEAIRRCSRAWKDVDIACIACFLERKSLMQILSCVTNQNLVSL